MRDRLGLKFNQHSREKTMPRYTPTKIADTRPIVHHSAEGAVRWVLIHFEAKQIEGRKTN